MRISARNDLPGTITRIERGAVNAEVTLRLEGGFEITAVITLNSVARLGLEVGKPAHAIIKASDVLVGVDD